MSNLAEIEAAAEARSLAQWLQGYPASEAASASPPGTDGFAKWRGRGHLPVGANAGEYLGLIRDGDSMDTIISNTWEKLGPVPKIACGKQ